MTPRFTESTNRRRKRLRPNTKTRLNTKPDSTDPTDPTDRKNQSSISGPAQGSRQLVEQQQTGAHGEVLHQPPEKGQSSIEAPGRALQFLKGPHNIIIS